MPENTQSPKDEAPFKLPSETEAELKRAVLLDVTIDERILAKIDLDPDSLARLIPVIVTKALKSRQRVTPDQLKVRLSEMLKLAGCFAKVQIDKRSSLGSVRYDVCKNAFEYALKAGWIDISDNGVRPTPAGSDVAEKVLVALGEALETGLKFKASELWPWKTKTKKKAALVKRLESLGVVRATAYNRLKGKPRDLDKADAIRALHDFIK